MRERGRANWYGDDTGTAAVSKAVRVDNPSAPVLIRPMAPRPAIRSTDSPNVHAPVTPHNDARRDALLAVLRDESWVMLKPSAVEGVGVFAVRDIPKGCRSMFSKPDAPEAWVSVPRDAIAALPPHARFLVENYCLYDETHYFVPADGFTKMDVACFLNHADTPNVISIDDGDYFEAVRDIAAGEELFIDYGEIVSGD